MLISAKHFSESLELYAKPYREHITRLEQQNAHLLATLREVLTRQLPPERIEGDIDQPKTVEQSDKAYMAQQRTRAQEQR